MFRQEFRHFCLKMCGLNGLIFFLCEIKTRALTSCSHTCFSSVSTSPFLRFAAATRNVRCTIYLSKSGFKKETIRPVFVVLMPQQHLPRSRLRLKKTKKPTRYRFVKARRTTEAVLTRNPWALSKMSAGHIRSPQALDRAQRLMGYEQKDGGNN